jgi:hypothetical protein
MTELEESYIKIISEKTTIGECDSYTKCENISFSDIVGNGTLENGGYFGQLLSLSSVHIADAKAKGHLTGSAAGEVFAQALTAAMQQAVMFELSHGKAQKEIANVDAQVKYQYHKMLLDNADLAERTRVDDAQIAKMECDCDISERTLVEKIRVDDAQISEENRMNTAKIAKMECDCDNATKQTDSKILVDSKQIEKTYKDMELEDKQIEKISSDIIEQERMNDEKIRIDDSQIAKWECDCKNSQDLMGAQADLYGIQAEGFRDNARQKIFEVQAQAYAMVFEAADLETVADCFNEVSLNNMFDEIKNRVIES